MRLNQTLRGKIVIICICFLVAGILINSIVHTSIFLNDYTKVLVSGVQVIAQTLKYKLDVLINLQLSLADMEEFEKECINVTRHYQDITYACVVDSTGRILYHSEPEKQGSYFQFPAGMSKIDSMDTKHGGFFSTGPFNNIALPLMDSSQSVIIGAVIIGFASDLVTNRINITIINTLIISVILAGIMIVLFLIILTRWVTRPFTNLISMINNIRAGGPIDLDQKFRPSSIEIRQVAAAFHNLMSELKSSRVQLENHTQELEIKVEARTRELNNVNNNLIMHIAALEHAREEEKRLQKELERSQKIEAISNLASGVAHDLNNILSGLINYPELLLMEMPPDSPFITSIKKIKRSGERAAAMVQDLLSLARRGVILMVPININNLIDDFIGSPEYQSLVGAHPDITISVKLDPNLSNIVGTPIHISKILMNLVTNSAEAIINGGIITITTENCVFKKNHHGFEIIPPGEYLKLSVTDNSVGMAKEQVEKIFEPFYTKKIPGCRNGTGLGMSVVFSSAKDHSGYIDVISEPGNGTTINIYFEPTSKELQSMEKSTSLDENRGTGERILVIDDLAEQRDIALTLLRKLGYIGIGAASGEEAIKFLQKNTVDCLVLDMIMEPGIDGYETYRRILEIHPWQKAIITSGFAETIRVLGIQKLGAGAFVKKPYSIEKPGIALRNELH